MTFRFYCPPPLANLNVEFELPDDIFHHAINVLRLRIGDEFIVFDGIGHAAKAKVTQLAKKRASAVLTKTLNNNLESPLQITLAQCLSVGDKMDWTVEKAVELGVSRIFPLFSAKSQIKLSAERAAKKIEHWQRIIISAAAQSGRNTLPELSQPLPFNQFIKTPDNAYKLLLHPNGAVPFKSLKKPKNAHVTILIGPESGFDANELQLATHAGYIHTVLGPRVLRTESAGLATISALQAIWGDF